MNKPKKAHMNTKNKYYFLSKIEKHTLLVTPQVI